MASCCCSSSGRLTLSGKNNSFHRKRNFRDKNRISATDSTVSHVIHRVIRLVMGNDNIFKLFLSVQNKLITRKQKFFAIISRKTIQINTNIYYNMYLYLINKYNKQRFLNVKQFTFARCEILTEFITNNTV